MRHSVEIDEISAALAEAQANFEVIKKNKVNPYFNNKYADLAEQIDATRKPLSQNGIFVFQSSEQLGDRLVVTTMLLHKSGQWLESDVSLKIAQDTPQGMGSIISYGRRYGRSMALDLSADEDDDANEAQGNGSQKTNNNELKPKNIIPPPAPPPVAAPAAALKPGPATPERIARVVDNFKKYDVSQENLEVYFNKKMEKWDNLDFDESYVLWKGFESGKKDKERMLESIAIRNL